MINMEVALIAVWIF